MTKRAFLACTVPNEFYTNITGSGRHGGSKKTFNKQYRVSDFSADYLTARAECAKDHAWLAMFKKRKILRTWCNLGERPSGVSAMLLLLLVSASLLLYTINFANT